VNAVHALWHGVAAVAVGAAAGVLVVYVTSSSPPATRPAAKQVSYDLYTHCGIDEARIDGRYYEAVHPLNDGSGNPPAGWGNPYQAGTMTLVSSAEAVFTDRAGHRVAFMLRPGARAFAHVCS